MSASMILKATLGGAAALALAGTVFAQVATGTSSTGTAGGVTPPPSTSVTTDTSRLATDCDKPAADARSNQQPRNAEVVNCGAGARTMGATSAATTAPATAPATTMGATGTTSSSTTAATTSTDTSASSTTTASNTDMSSDQTTGKKAKKVRKARADRG